MYFILTQTVTLYVHLKQKEKKKRIPLWQTITDYFEFVYMCTWLNATDRISIYTLKKNMNIISINTSINISRPSINKTNKLRTRFKIELSCF